MAKSSMVCTIMGSISHNNTDLIGGWATHLQKMGESQQGSSSHFYMIKMGGSIEIRLLDPNSWMVYFMENPLKMDDLGIPIICSIVGRDDDQPVDWVSVKKGCPKPESQGCSHAVSMVALGVQYSIV